MSKKRYYFSNRTRSARAFNRWDGLILLLFFSFLFFLGWAGMQMSAPYHLGQPPAITLSPDVLPGYALRTVLRMFVALIFSLLFTLVFGTWAAKNKRAEQLIIPAIDVLQSVPVLSFLSITVVGFIHLFPNSMLGPECASIFAIFTAQVWNITLSFYQSLKTVPYELREASDMFQLSSWQRFWKVEVPFSMPGVLWNLMMSMSASWFFVVLSEAISVSHQDIRLPGVGSYIALAIQQRDMHAVGFAIVTMVVVIFLYDQFLFRPLLTWSEKFKTELTPDEQSYHSWLVNWVRRAKFTQWVGQKLNHGFDFFINIKWFNLSRPKARKEPDFLQVKRHDRLFNGVLTLLLVGATVVLLRFILRYVGLGEIGHVFVLGAVTGTRVIVLIVLSSLLWVPVGVWIARRPRLAQRVQPIIQFLAAFPANLFYPLFVVAIVTYHLNVEIWVTPLMILGTQWYILFNVIAGAANMPRDLYLVADNFGVKGWQWWRRLALPGIFPYYITGAITAAGGAWNASIVAEWVSWGNVTLKATGLGEYIQAWTLAGDFPKIALGTAMMCLYVLAFNHFLWRPLYRLAEKRYTYSY